ARGRRALQRRARARPDPAAEVPDAGRSRFVRVHRRADGEGPGEAIRRDHSGADGAAQVRAQDDQGDGVRRLLPDRLGLHRVCEAQRDQRRPGPRLDRRLACRLLPEITDVDPMKYDLLFERFLNPGRKSLPDADIDFAVDGRDRVINYVAEKYGRDRVAQIITFGTMAARAAVRDAGRVLEIPYGTVDKIAK